MLLFMPFGRSADFPMIDGVFDVYDSGQKLLCLSAAHRESELVADQPCCFVRNVDDLRKLARVDALRTGMKINRLKPNAERGAAAFHDRSGN